MERAVQMLIAQGHSGNRSKIMMVGDRFDTDVRGGLSAELRTCLIETGCHTAAYQRFYRADPACYSAACIADLIPRAQRLQIQVSEPERAYAAANSVANSPAKDGASDETAGDVASDVGDAQAGDRAGNDKAVDSACDVAGDVASQQSTAGPEGSPPTSPPCSPPPEQLLAEWVLAQGNLLRPGACELRPRLEMYFAAVSAEGAVYHQGAASAFVMHS